MKEPFEPEFNYRELLDYRRKKNMSFSNFVDRFIENPQDCLKTSSTLISEAIKYFGYEIVIRSGEPVLSFNVFKDIFSNGINAVYGQEMSIKKVVNVMESISKEAGPNRGLVLVGPPASGKTNIVDLISLALEHYSKEENVALYSFYYRFTDLKDKNKVVEIRSVFRHNPILFFTTILKRDQGITSPRQKLFEYINQQRANLGPLFIPNYYQYASMDKRNLDILESLILNPHNHGKSLFDILEEYVRVEEIEFANAQAFGISNIDDMSKLVVKTLGIDTRQEAIDILNQHLPTKYLKDYVGALVDANRGLLHIHDAFGEHCQEKDYKPLLMLLGSGKISLESTQTAIDTTVIVTTNLEDMECLDKQLTSSKLLDRIEKIPVNYLLDANSEMDILKRDMAAVRQKYDVDPHLFRVASYFSVMTRLNPPMDQSFPQNWSQTEKDLYCKITPEKKLFIYSCEVEDPFRLIQDLPFWHPFRNEAFKLGIDLFNEKELQKYINRRPEALTLEQCGLFSREEIELISPSFMRRLLNEHRFIEGQSGISIRQLQNIMRNTITNSDGRKIHVGDFLDELQSVVEEGCSIHNWLKEEPKKLKSKIIGPRKVGDSNFVEGEGDYGDFKGLVKVTKSIYLMIIYKEILACTVDRDPKQIEVDLRKYVQNVLLMEAVENKAFSHIMVPLYSYIDPVTGEKVEKPDGSFMSSIEKVLKTSALVSEDKFRHDIARKYFELVDNKKLKINEGKTILSSMDDNFMVGFDREFSLLLSHRRTEGSIDGEILAKAFHTRFHQVEEYKNFPEDIREFCENILRNMCIHYRYSPSLALDTIIYALRNNIVNFKEILN